MTSIIHWSDWKAGGYHSEKLRDCDAGPPAFPRIEDFIDAIPACDLLPVEALPCVVAGQQKISPGAALHAGARAEVSQAAFVRRRSVASDLYSSRGGHVHQ